MSTPSEEAVERFRRRSQGTDDATLYRNLQAGVYGPPGSTRRAIAERALQQRFAAAAEALQVATKRGTAKDSDQVERLRRQSTWAFRLSIAALALAILGLALTLGWI